MVKTKIIGAAGRFGSRYGQYIKRRIADIEFKQRKKQECPFCNGTAKRTSKGIWLCKKCKKKFASHAYFLPKGAPKLNTKTLKKQESKSKIDKEGNKEKKQENLQKTKKNKK